MKPFWKSRTFWVNIFAAVALFVQNQYGYAVPVEFQGYALVLVNLVLRAITKEGISV